MKAPKALISKHNGRPWEKWEKTVTAIISSSQIKFNVMFQHFKMITGIKT